MRNYMQHITATQSYQPRYFKPEEDKVILNDHVTRFSGVQLCRMLRGYPSVEDMWSTRESLKEVATATESMSMGAFQDMNRFLHFADDWDDEDGAPWADTYLDDKVDSPEFAAPHRRKFGNVEDAFNAAWKFHVLFGKDLTFDESRIAGWFHSGMTIGPEPKPIRTGATLHSMCVTSGELASYMVHVRTYGGKHDGDLNRTTENTGTTQKFINLLEEFLDPWFVGRGCCVTMDSAYMGELLAMVATEAWKINVVGTSQSNRCGSDSKEVAAERKKTKKGSYEGKFWVHKTKPLCVAIWADNAHVLTLSNHHSPRFHNEANGVRRRKRNKNGTRDQLPSWVKIPEQTKRYVEFFLELIKRTSMIRNSI